MVAHRIMGVSLMFTGDLEGSRAHLDHAIALYDPAQHRPLAARFGHDLGVATLTWWPLVQWLLGHSESASAGWERAVNEARESGHVVTLMYALGFGSTLNLLSGNYAMARIQGQELLTLAQEKNAALWIARATTFQGCILAATGNASDAVQMITSGLTASRATGTTFWLPLYAPYLAKAYAELGKFADARRCVDEATMAVRTTKETMFEAEVHRIAGEIKMLSPEPDATKAEAYFKRALAVARAQQAKSFELRAAMSLARLWRDQGKPQQARELLAPVYGWFTEGFDMRDLKEAKALLDELHA
jgi:predicted ATPase